MNLILKINTLKLFILKSISSSASLACWECILAVKAEYNEWIPSNEEVKHNCKDDLNSRCFSYY